MQITTAINFSGEYLEGFVTNNEFHTKRLINVANTQVTPLTKEEILELVNELQKVYSTMNNVEKSIKKVTQREQPVFTTASNTSSERPVSNPTSIGEKKVTPYF